jgi:2-methylisocitrate lyase-like PEP mutase family enzyme
MTDQIRKAELFRGLHVPGKPLILFNVWDAGSAKAVASVGAKAIATSSWSVADANGFADGEKVPLTLAIATLRRIVAVTDLPVTVDLESGYGVTPEEVGGNIALAIEAGAIGCNLEDSFPANGALREVDDQCARIRHARQIADATGIAFFLNARTDVFFQNPTGRDKEEMLQEAIERARAYAEAGADGLFVPGLQEIAPIGRLAQASSLPLNIMVSDIAPSTRVLAEHGVARISHGPGPYLLAMKALGEAGRGATGLSDSSS